jgi:transposase
MSTGRWAEAKQDRNQHMLIPPSLDDMIPDGHKVRQLEVVLLKLDWANWEAEYNLESGQPPIHPRIIAGAILYGLTERIRSSRELEKACGFRTDFMWLLCGRTIDHSTFAKFRTRFTAPLNELFKQVALVALKGKLELDLAIDGTRMRSSSSRSGAMTEKTIEKRAEAIAANLSDAMEKMEQQDLFDNPESASSKQLQNAISNLKTDQKKLAKALKEAKKRNAVKQSIEGKNARSVRIPITDSDSYILNNKEGGFAPNYTPTAAVDAESRVIVSAGVPEGNRESTVVESAVADAESITGEKPDSVLFDSGFSTGTNLKSMADSDIAAYSSSGKTSKDNPALRDDLSVAVPEDELCKLPTKGKRSTMLSKEAFVYDEGDNCYWCPMGQKLSFLKTKKSNRGQVIYSREYRAVNCDGCKLAGQCISGKSKRRMITRDEYESYRDQMKVRMKTDEGKEKYSLRAPAGEGVFAHIKHNMGIRQFMHRGMEKVTDEWTWICTAYNMSKILNAMN